MEERYAICGEITKVKILVDKKWFKIQLTFGWWAPHFEVIRRAVYICARNRKVYMIWQSYSKKIEQCPCDIYIFHSCVYVVQGPADLASDFRIKESADSTISFESVLHSGSYVGINGPAGFQTKLNVFLVV